MIIIQPSDTVVQYGSSVLLTCLAVSIADEQIDNIIWERDSQLIVASNSSDGGRISIYNDYILVYGVYTTRSILKICSVTFQDEGLYSCVANDSVGSTTVYFNLSIYTNGKTIIYMMIMYDFFFVHTHTHIRVYSYHIDCT